MVQNNGKTDPLACSLNSSVARPSSKNPHGLAVDFFARGSMLSLLLQHKCLVTLRFFNKIRLKKQRLNVFFSRSGQYGYQFGTYMACQFFMHHVKI